MPIRKVTLLLQKEFVKNVLTLMTGTALGQGIALLLSPLITRLFSLEDFSTFEQFSFLLSIISVIICGKYEYSIMQPKENEDARHLLYLCLRIAFISSLVLLGILLFSSNKIAELLQCPSLKYLLLTLPVALFLAGSFNAFNYWFSRKKNYKVAATSKFLYSAIGEPFKLTAGLVSPGPGGLILSTIFGHAIATWHSWKSYVKDEPRLFKAIDKTRLTALAKRYNNYPKYAIWGSLLNNLAQWAHVAIFGFYYGTAAIVPIAYIGLSRRVFFNPLGILASSYGQVFYQRIEQIQDGGALQKFYLTNLLRFMLFAALMIAVVYLLPYNTFGIIFGDEWNEALTYLRILCFWYALNFVISSLSFIFNRLQLQKYTLISDAVHFIAILTSFSYAHATGCGVLEAVQYMVITKVAYLLLNLAAILYFLRRNQINSITP